MNKVYSFLQRYSFFNKFEERLKHICFGKDQVSLHEILAVFLEKLSSERLIAKADSIAFNFIAAIFPGIIFLFTLIPYIPIPELDKQILSIMANPQFFPSSMNEFLSGTIEDIVSKQRGGLLSFGFFLTLYLATNGMSSLMSAFNSSYRSLEKRMPMRKKIIAVLLTVLLTFVLFLAVAILALSQVASEYMLTHDVMDKSVVDFLFSLAKYLLIILLFFVVISLIYFIAPAVKRRWRFISPGSTMATFLCVSFTVLFTFYVENFGNYNKLYGSIGALIVLMFWLKFISLALLVGFEINASIDLAKHKKQQG